MTILKRAGAPPGYGEAPENHSGLSATEYENPEYNREPPEFQHRRSLASDPRACRLMQQVYDAGPRAVLEMLDELKEREDAYKDIPPDEIAARYDADCQNALDGMMAGLDAKKAEFLGDVGAT